MATSKVIGRAARCSHDHRNESDSLPSGWQRLSSALDQATHLVPPAAMPGVWYNRNKSVRTLVTEGRSG